MSPRTPTSPTDSVDGGDADGGDADGAWNPRRSLGGGGRVAGEVHGLGFFFQKRGPT